MGDKSLVFPGPVRSDVLLCYHVLVSGDVLDERGLGLLCGLFCRVSSWRARCGHGRSSSVYHLAVWDCNVVCLLCGALAAGAVVCTKRKFHVVDSPWC